MSPVRFTPAAKQHLTAIWRYSAAQWGERRADRYLRAINEALNQAAAGNRQIRPCEHYGAGLHSIRVGAHIIFLRRDEEAAFLIVVGVLHQQMEPSRHLSEE